MKKIIERWREFEARVMPKDAPEVQRTEMRRAFFAGFAEGLVFLVELAPLSETEAKAAVESARKQCEGFSIAIEMGEA